MVFEHVVAALVHGSGYERIASPGCSDRTIRRRLAEWAAMGAAEALLWSRAGDEAATTTDIGAAKVLACDVFRKIAEEAIQLHGGIGLTDEHMCHLFMKRAMLNLQLGGDLDVWRERAGRQALAELV